MKEVKSIVHSNIILTTTRTFVLDTPSQDIQKNQNSSLFSCVLQWRQGSLWVKHAKTEIYFSLPALSNKEWLRSCLKTSAAKLICLDLALDEAELEVWADACEEVNKPVFLLVPSTPKCPQKRAPISWRIKRIADWLIAALLLLALSPVLLGLMLLIKLCTPGPSLLQQWRVGQRGKLFRLIKFRAMHTDTENHHLVMVDSEELHEREDAPRLTSVGRWMHKYGLASLPMLINVLRGEMSLVGIRPWNLCEAIQLNLEERRQLNALPGIIGEWGAMNQALDIDVVSRLNLEYLHTWSLRNDLKILLTATSKLFSRFGKD